MRTAALLGTLLWAASFAQAQLIQYVKEFTARGDFKSAENIIGQYKARFGETPEMYEGHSWLGRGALGAKRFDDAERYAEQTYSMVQQVLKTRKLDAEPRLPIALGAAIEVQGQVLGGRGQRSEAVAYLNKELAKYGSTSIRARIQKNIHLLSLEGKPAPPLELKEFLGGTLETMAKLKGKPVLLFFWAHWCVDCKIQGPILERLQQEFPGLAIVAPTQTYGYAGGGEDVPRPVEIAYMKRVLAERYPWLANLPVPVSEQNFRVYGSSSSPTLVLLDRAGMVRLYKPGSMTYEELRPIIAKWK